MNLIKYVFSYKEPSEYGYSKSFILYRIKEGLLTDTFEDDVQEIAVKGCDSIEMVK